MEKGTCKLLWFGLGGHAEEYGTVRNGNYSSRSTVSGYDSPERWIEKHRFPEDTAYNGVPVLDKRPAVEKDPMLAVRSPMLGIDLPAGEVDPCPEPSGMLRAGVAGNSYGALLALQDKAKATSKAPGPLDQIALPEYLQWWASHGARVGRVVVQMETTLSQELIPEQRLLASIEWAE